MIFPKAFLLQKKKVGTKRCMIKSYDSKRELELKLYNGILSPDFAKKVQHIKRQ